MHNADHEHGGRQWWCLNDLVKDSSTNADVKCLQTLFHETLQTLFAERPDDPLRFVVEQLQQKLAERDAAATSQ
jgi:hypothetical protein